MSARDLGAGTLPSSHVFFTAACGARQKTVAVSTWLAASLAAVAGICALWSVGCTIFIFGHDSLLSASMRRERDLQYMYEDRIAALQRSLDRTTSQQAQLERTVGTKLDTLSALAGTLQRKASTMEGLAEAVHQLAPAGSGRASQQASGSVLKPPPAPAAGTPLDRDARASWPDATTATRLSSLTASLSGLESGQQDALERLKLSIGRQVSSYQTALTEAGLPLARFGRAVEASPLGGPFIPLDTKSVQSPFERTALQLRDAIGEAGHLRSVVAHIPFGKPLDGDPEITSTFGPRTDPFLGRPALHTGLDLREDTGTAVLATAPGRVTVAGLQSGYGLMVEVDHGSGLATRYAHLSALSVEVGQQVANGAIVGRVGATGRATGPHLHYETRIDGEPVDPMRLLTAGHHLAAANGA